MRAAHDSGMTQQQTAATCSSDPDGGVGAGDTQLSGPKTCSLCDRSSCRPDDYQPLCTRHYMRSVVAAQRDARARFNDHIEQLKAKGRGSSAQNTDR